MQNRFCATYPDASEEILKYATIYSLERLEFFLILSMVRKSLDKQNLTFFQKLSYGSFL
jgi:hypothetical protein